MQLIRYGAEVSPTALPKTKRSVDPVAPATLAAEVTRIGTMRSALAADAPAPAHGRTWHVSPQGNAAGPGSAASPFNSIPRALAVVKPGDTILVAVGDYVEPAPAT